MEKEAGTKLDFQNPESKVKYPDAIQEMSEGTKVDFKEIYDFFEMIHPNLVHTC